MSLAVCALIAAAGQSRRMGYPKALKPIKGEPTVVLLARQFSDAGLREIFITLPKSLRHDAELCSKLLSLPTQVLPNRFDHYGYAGSILTVLEELRGSFDGILICPIDASTSQALILAMLNLARTWAHKPSIILPIYNLKVGHPVYLSKHYFHALRHCHQIGGLRGLIAQKSKNIKCLFWPDPCILANVNYPGDKKN